MLVRGYSLMLGLHKQERADVFDEDGWFHTGDRGLFRDGWFFFTGRQSDLIKTKGANVAPAEVEKAILAEEGVGPAFVFGVDHPVDGQEVVALVVGEDVDPDRAHRGAPATPLVVQGSPPHLRDRRRRRALPEQPEAGPPPPRRTGRDASPSRPAARRDRTAPGGLR